MSHLENPQAKGVYTVIDGWPLNGFEERTYDKIEEVLCKMQEEAE